MAIKDAPNHNPTNRMTFSRFGPSCPKSEEEKELIETNNNMPADAASKIPSTTSRLFHKPCELVARIPVTLASGVARMNKAESQ
jgi:hypothetical protein